MSNKKNGLRRFFSTEFFLGLILIGGYLAYYEFKTHRNNNWTQARIEKAFSENLVLVKHDFAIKLVFHDRLEEPFYFVRDGEGHFMQWNKSLEPNTVYGCGFIKNNNGDCITSENLGNPMPKGWDMIELRKEVKLVREMFDIRSEGHYEIFTVSIGYYPHGYSPRDPSAFTPCKVDGIFDSGIAELKARKKTGQEKKRTEFLRVNYKNQLSKNEELFVLGLPLDRHRDENVQAVSGQATLDSIAVVEGSYNDWRELYFRLPSIFMFEGAPVFNRKGNIVGVMTRNEKGYKAAFTTLERQ